MKEITIRSISPAAVTPRAIHAPVSAPVSAPRPGRPGREKDWNAAARNNLMPDFRINLKQALEGDAEKGLAPNRLLGMVKKNLPIHRSIQEQMEMIAAGIAAGPEAFQAAMMSAATPTGHQVVALKDYVKTNPGSLTLDKEEIGNFLNDLCKSFRVLLGLADERVIAQNAEDAATDSALKAQDDESADDESADDESADDESADDESADDESADDESAPGE